MFGIIQKLKEKIGLSFYLRPQTYELKQEVVVENTTAGTRDFAMVLGVPSEGLEQKIIEGPKFSPSPASVRTESLYDNQYAVFYGGIGPGESLVFELSFKAQIWPKQTELEQTFTMADYRRLNPQVLEQWTASTRHIEARNPELIRLAEKVRDGASDVWSVIQNVNEYVMGRLRYGNPIEGLYSLDDVLRRELVDCGGFDVLFIGLLHTLGIPARLVSGFWIGHHDNNMHAWVEVLLPNGHWAPADPSVEQLSRYGRTLKSGRLGFVGSDRLIVSYGADLPLEVKGKSYSVEILQHPRLLDISENAGLMVSSKWQAHRL